MINCFERETGVKREVLTAHDGALPRCSSGAGAVAPGASVPESKPPEALEGAPEQPWVLYLLECAGERLYAGITNDLAARFRAHSEGRGARFTRAFPPVRIVAASKLPSRSAALRAEYALKQQTRSMKVRFLAGCGTPLDLDETRSPPRQRG